MSFVMMNDYLVNIIIITPRTVRSELHTSTLAVSRTARTTASSRACLTMLAAQGATRWRRNTLSPRILRPAPAPLPYLARNWSYLSMEITVSS